MASLFSTKIYHPGKRMFISCKRDLNYERINKMKMFAFRKFESSVKLSSNRNSKVSLCARTQCSIVVIQSSSPFSFQHFSYISVQIIHMHYKSIFHTCETLEKYSTSSIQNIRAMTVLAHGFAMLDAQCEEHSE